MSTYHEMIRAYEVKWAHVQRGFHWIREVANAEPKIAHWDGKRWEICGCEGYIIDPAEVLSGGPLVPPGAS